MAVVEKGLANDLNLNARRRRRRCRRGRAAERQGRGGGNGRSGKECNWVDLILLDDEHTQTHNQYIRLW